MATIPSEETIVRPGVVQITWTPLAGGDDGAGVVTAHFSDRTVQATGDGTSITIEGSNDGTNWFELNDTAGVPIDMDATTDAVVLVRENPLMVRPVVTGGSSTTVILIGSTER